MQQADESMGFTTQPTTESGIKTCMHECTYKYTHSHANACMHAYIHTYDVLGGLRDLALDFNLKTHTCMKPKSVHTHTLTHIGKHTCTSYIHTANTYVVLCEGALAFVTVWSNKGHAEIMRVDTVG